MNEYEEDTRTITFVSEVPVNSLDKIILYHIHEGVALTLQLTRVSAVFHLTSRQHYHILLIVMYHVKDDCNNSFQTEAVTSTNYKMRKVDYVTILEIMVFY